MAKIEIHDTSKNSVFDPSGGRWVCYCVTHGKLCNFRTRRKAQKLAKHPWEWCGDCAADNPDEPHLDLGEL